MEPLFDEMKRYVRFGAIDESALFALAPHARPHFSRIADEFYVRIQEHENASAILATPDVVARLKTTLCQWLEKLFTGPWDEQYYQQRTKIGQAHVRVGLSQRYMFGAINLIRVALLEITQHAYARNFNQWLQAVVALHKIIDLELCVMMDSYREAFVEKVQHLERMEKTMLERRAERMTALGIMAAGLAHEIRNPLNAAHLQLTLLQRRLTNLDQHKLLEAQKAAELAGSELKRLGALVDEFLQFARPQPLRIATADLRATADGIVSLLLPEAEALGIFLSHTTSDSVTAKIDDERMKQVLLNLVRNAMEATGPGGSVTVSVRREEDFTILEVADDGPGIPSSDAPIFEPFFTTKPAGTGLGLSVVHRIVTDHGGRVDVASRPGRTVFRVMLPG